MTQWVKSIEKVTITLAASTTSASSNLSKSQTLANCFPLCQTRVTTPNGEQFETYAVDVYFLSSPDRVVAERSDATTSALVVEIDVIECDSTYIDVYQLDASMLTSEEGVNFAIGPPSVDHAKAIFLATYRIGASGTTYYDDALVRVGWATGDTDARLYRRDPGGAVEATIYVAVCKNTEWDVQDISPTMNTTSSADTTITSVTEGSTVVWSNQTYNLGQVRNDNATYDCNLTSSTNVNVQRDGASSRVDCKTWVIEFEGNESVEHGTISAQGATASQNVTLSSSVDADESSVYCPAGIAGAMTAGSFPGGSGSDVPDAYTAWDFVDDDTVRVQHHTGGGEANNDISWEAIQWDVQAAAAPSRRVMVIG